MNNISKISLLVILLSVVLILTQSCNVKKDCRGRTKHRLSNGVWI